MRNLFCTLSHGALAILLVAGTTATNAQDVENRAVVVKAEAEELPRLTALRLIYPMVVSLR